MTGELVEVGQDGEESMGGVEEGEEGD